MIVLTDGVPNVGLGSNNPYYSDTTITQTREELQSLTDSNIQVITMLTGIDDEDYVPLGVSKSFGQIIKASTQKEKERFVLGNTCSQQTH